MSYKSWFDAHAAKHAIIVKRLREEGLDKKAVIGYFDFENMRHKEPDFCPLYKENKKCHDMESLNCYLCACPNFRFDDAGIEKLDTKTQYSFCDIDSKDGAQGVYGDAIHQDCSKCTVPHHKAYIEKVFKWSWVEIMDDVELDKE
jgi:hypothetical protein